MHTEGWRGCPCLEVVPPPESENSKVWLRTTSDLPHFSPYAHCKAFPYSPSNTHSQIAWICPTIREFSWCKLSLFNRNIPYFFCKLAFPSFPLRLVCLRHTSHHSLSHPAEAEVFFPKGIQNPVLRKDMKKKFMARQRCWMSWVWNPGWTSAAGQFGICFESMLICSLIPGFSSSSAQKMKERDAAEQK